MDNSVPFPVYGIEEIGIFTEILQELAVDQNVSLESAFQACEEAERLLEKILIIQGPFLVVATESFSIRLDEEIPSLTEFQTLNIGHEASEKGSKNLVFSWPRLSIGENEASLFSLRQGPKQRSAYVKLLNQSLRSKNEQIEKLFHSKKFLLNFLAHELRNPLTAILNSIELVKACPDEIIELQIPEMLEDAGQDMKRLVDEVLDFAKIEGGTLSYDMKTCEVRELCESFARYGEALVQSSPLEWRIHGVEGLDGERVSVDPFRFRQVLSNLLSNSMKFTESGHILFDVNSGEQCITFGIHDTGKGIEEKFKSEIFEEFTQESAHISRQFGGAGLGLNICYRLIKNMKGRLWFDSKQGRGTSFFIELPLAKV